MARVHRLPAAVASVVLAALALAPSPAVPVAHAASPVGVGQIVAGSVGRSSLKLDAVYRSNLKLTWSTRAIWVDFDRAHPQRVRRRDRPDRAQHDRRPPRQHPAPTGHGRRRTRLRSGAPVRGVGVTGTTSAPWNAWAEHSCVAEGSGTRVGVRFEGRLGGMLRLLDLMPDRLASKIFEADFERLRRLLDDPTGQA